MKLTNSNANFSLSRDSKHYLYAGIIRNQVLSKEFNLPHIDFSTDHYDTADNAIYLLADGRCVGCCRVIVRRECGTLPVEDYIDLSTAFGINTKGELDATCEFSRLAILPEYQGAKGASLLIGAVAEHSMELGLRHLVYCSNARKMGIFNAIAQRKGLHVQLDTDEFQYADIAHATFQAAVVRMNPNADGEMFALRKAG